MCQKFTPEELKKMNHEAKDDVIYLMQEKLDKLEKDYENLIEQVRLANQQKFGRSTEKLSEITGQLSFFNEAEVCADERIPEPTVDEVVIINNATPKKKKKKGQREEDLKDIPQKVVLHDVPEEDLVEKFGEGNYRKMDEEVYWQLHFEPAKWTAEKHIIAVYVGTSGLRQDEFLRGDHPKTLFRGSLATPSLVAAVVNSKYVNSNPLERIAREFQVNGLQLSKQTLSNWMLNITKNYFKPIYDHMKEVQLKAHVNQCDETPVEVTHDGRKAGIKSYMWVHLTGELSPGPKIVVYEYQKTRHSDHPKEYYKDFNGILMTDGLEQYHKLAREVEGVTNANCFAHARRHFANAIKAMEKGNEEAIRQSVAYQALARISTIYKLEGTLKDLSPEERLQERQASIKPLVEEYFAWIKDVFKKGWVLPKSETAKGLAYCINQEEYLKVFLEDGEVPIDDSASERALRNFTIGRKNWVIINTIKGAESSAMLYSLTETARLNKLNVYYYIKYLLEQMLLQKATVKTGEWNIEQLEEIMPWSKTLPKECYSKRRE